MDLVAPHKKFDALAIKVHPMVAITHSDIGCLVMLRLAEQRSKLIPPLTGLEWVQVAIHGKRGDFLQIPAAHLLQVDKNEHDFTSLVDCFDSKVACAFAKFIDGSKDGFDGLRQRGYSALVINALRLFDALRLLI